MKLLDITFDLETCDVSPSAAPMQLAAIAWNRYVPVDGDADPFMRDGDNELHIFDERTDLSFCVMDGYSFSQDTIDFWSRQKPEVQAIVTDTDRQKLSPRQLYERFFRWITEAKEQYKADHVALWCQGQDFDIPMMKFAASKYGLRMPVSQYSFGDARTLAFSFALKDAERADDVYRRPKVAPYEALPPIPEQLDGYSHDAVYDCIRTTWSTWHLLYRMRLL